MQIVDHPPRVFVVGLPIPQATGLQQYLRHRGEVWNIYTENNTASFSEALVEVAGRVCYQSWENPKKSTTDQYIQESIVSHKHGCYDGETDVLTLLGWKNWKDVNKNDQFATRTSSGQLEYHKPSRLIRFDYTGSMYKATAQGFDLLVTPEHNMLACLTQTTEGRKKEDFTLISATDLGQKSYACTKFANWCGGTDIITHDEASLLGFAIGDGYLSTASVCFHIKKERKILWLLKLCASIGLFVRENNDNVYSVTIPEHLRKFFYAMYSNNKEKQIPSEIIQKGSKEVLQGILLGLLESDGSQHRGAILFDTTSSVLASQIQQVCLHVGLAATESMAVCYKDRKKSYGDKPIFRFNITERVKPEINKWSGSLSRSSWIPDWSGEVFCAEVPNNTLYVRRKGKCVWSGNSVLEHVWVNLLVADVCRSVEMEMVRHGDGTAFSWESQRYTDKHLRFIVPPLYRENEVYRAAFTLSCERTEKDYRELIAYADSSKLDGLPGTIKRKRIKEAARSVLGNAVGADGLFSLNLRAARHIIQLRTDDGADQSIRETFYEIYRAIAPLFPATFADAREEPGFLGVPQVKFLVEKV